MTNFPPGHGKQFKSKDLTSVVTSDFVHLVLNLGHQGASAPVERATINPPSIEADDDNCHHRQAARCSTIDERDDGQMTNISGQGRVSRRVISADALLARTSTLHRSVEMTTCGCVRFIFVRDGSAVLASELGNELIGIGDVVLLGANTLCRAELKGNFAITTVHLDTDFVIDQVFWRYSGVLADRIDAIVFAEAMYAGSQVLRLDEERAETLTLRLDELVELSLNGGFARHFCRMQSLWFSIAHVLGPFTRAPDLLFYMPSTSGLSSMTCRSRPAPLRPEVRRGAALLRADPARRWSVADLASELHLSKSQVGRLFVEAFGMPPIAYLTMLRTERMAGLLRTTRTPVGVIAREVGWGDPDFATRQFRRRSGVTPRVYREMIGSGLS